MTTKRGVLPLMRQHDTVDRRTNTCKCGFSLDTKVWLEHLADVLEEAFPMNEPKTIPARHSDPSTSHSAAASMTMRAGSQRARLLEAFWKMHDATDEEAMRNADGVAPTSEYSKRCSELREAGFITETGETRASGITGMQRIVSRITHEGIQWMDAQRR